MIQNAVHKYLQRQGREGRTLKAVLFDMDGVLFDSMRYHAEAWYKAMTIQGVPCDLTDFYMYEGCTGSYTIDALFARAGLSSLSENKKAEIYKLKSQFFNELPEALPMDGSVKLIRQIQAMGITTVLVTGSGQMSLLERLNGYYNNAFPREKIVCAYDVKHGKPHPEPYLMGLEKAGVAAHEAIVIENAPMGVKSSSSANIFTIAANTGPLQDQILYDNGADVLFHSLNEISEQWNDIQKALTVLNR